MFFKVLKQDIKTENKLKKTCPVDKSQNLVRLITEFDNSLTMFGQYQSTPKIKMRFRQVSLPDFLSPTIQLSHRFTNRAMNSLRSRLSREED